MTFLRSTSNPDTAPGSQRRSQVLVVFGLIAFALIAVLGGTRTGASATTPTPPANDNLGAATVLSGAAGRVWQKTEGATTQLGEPASAGQHTVWFKWTAPSTMT